MFTIISSNKQIQNCVQLAEEIWEEHYTSLIGPEQVAYMLNKFQSFDSVKSQLKEGCRYYLVEENKGYFSFIEKHDCLFISKLYVHKDYRSEGIGNAMIDFIIQNTGTQKKMRLTVNRGNSQSISFYRKNGFEIIEEKDFDIGKNFYMNDYIMEKSLV